MITQRWKPSGARSSARPWRKVTSGPRTGSDGSYSNSSRLFITGAGSTALWGINHLWTSNKQTTNNERSRLKYCDHKKGGREPRGNLFSTRDEIKHADQHGPHSQPSPEAETPTIPQR